VGVTEIRNNQMATKSGQRGRHVRTKLLLPILALGIAMAGTACLPASSGPPASRAGVIASMNADRSAHGLNGLGDDAQLDGVAQNWANYLASVGQIGHQDLYGLITSPSMVGWRRLTENIMSGPPSTTDGMVEGAWMSSPAHQANVLDPWVNRVGVGIAHDGAGRTYVVADFGSR
jgi:uncharacterized protein YkwD